MSEKSPNMADDIGSMDRTRFARLSILSADIYAKLLRSIAEKQSSAKSTLNIFQAHPKWSERLTTDEKEVFQTLASDGYSKCDPTLMYKILRRILPPPRLKWGNTPDLTDVKVSDDVERIRILRNTMAHRTSASVTELEAQPIIQQSLNIAKRVDIYLKSNSGDKFKTSINNILTMSIDKALEDEYVKRGLEIEALQTKLEIQEEKYNLTLKSGKKLKLFLAEVLFEKDDKPDDISVVAEVTGFNETEDKDIIDYINANSDKLNHVSELVVVKKAKLGSILIFFKLIQLMPDEIVYQQIILVMKKIFHELSLQRETTTAWNVDIMLFPDEFLIEDDRSDSDDDDDDGDAEETDCSSKCVQGKKSLMLDLAVKSSSIKTECDILSETSHLIQHIITKTNFIHHKLDATETASLEVIIHPSSSYINKKHEIEDKNVDSSNLDIRSPIESPDATVISNICTERKELMILKVDSMCNWDKFVMAAPISIAILGHIMAMATKPDFALSKTIKGGFKFVKYPSSFRACLVQIGTSSCKAFKEADIYMDKLRKNTIQLQSKIKLIIDILVNHPKPGEVVWEHLRAFPLLKEIKDDTDECLHLAEETEHLFYNTILLIGETIEASATATEDYGDSIREVLEKKELLQKETKLKNTLKRHIEIEKNFLIEHLMSFEEIDDKTGILSRINADIEGRDIVRVVNCSFQKMIAFTGTLSSLTSKGNPEKTVQPPKKLEKTSLKDSQHQTELKGNSDQTVQLSTKLEETSLKDSQHQTKFYGDYQHVNQLHMYVKQMYVLFTKNINPINQKLEMKFDLNEHLNTISRIQYVLKQCNSKLPSSLESTCLEIKEMYRKALQLCDEMLDIEKENKEELFKSVEKLKNESKKLKSKARNVFQQNPQLHTDKTSKSKMAVEKANEKAGYEVKLQRKEDDHTRKTMEKTIDIPVSNPSTAKLQTSRIFKLKKTSEEDIDNARYYVELQIETLEDVIRAREKLQNEVRKMDQKQNRVLEEISKTRIDCIYFEEIQKTLKEGLIVLSELKEQWAWLVLFCHTINSVLDVCPTQTCYTKRMMFVNRRECHLARDVILEIVTFVNSVAYAVELIAAAYTDISKKHLIPNTASVIAYDSTIESKQLEKKRRQIDEDCKGAIAEIWAEADKRKEYFDRKINEINESLKEQLNKLPPLPHVHMKEN